MNKISKNAALGLGVFFGMAATGAAVPVAVTGGVFATGIMYVGKTLKDKLKPPSPDS
jgi:hypothetical protein